MSKIFFYPNLCKVSILFWLIGISSLTAIEVQAQTNFPLRHLLFNSNNNVAGLDFGTIPPTPYLTGIAGAYEAIAHYEDEQGNLLFWFNSNGVYDANANFMAGSWGIFADANATEVCIAPVPEQENQYYIFYNAQQCSSLYYSIVDMSVNNGGSIGDVVTLNTSIDIVDQYAEGLEVVRIPNSPNYWLLSYNCSVGGFFKSMVTTGGVSTPELIHSYPIPEGFDGRGEFDYHAGRIGMCYAWSDAVFTAEFDPQTGLISNPIILDDEAINSNPFGVEFSPDGTKMYFSLWYSPNINNVFQYDFNTDVLSSWLPEYGNTSNWISGLGQIEQGRDNKLYIIEDAGEHVLVIDNPNETAENISFSTIFLGTTTGLGISDPIQWNSDQYVNVYDCVEQNSTTLLSHELTNNETTWFNYHDSSEILFTGASYELDIDNEPLYITAINTGGDYINFEINLLPQIELVSSITIVPGLSTELNASISPINEETTYYWFPETGLSDFNALNPEAAPEETTTYTLTVMEDECISQSEITVFVAENLQLLNDTLCINEGNIIDLSLQTDSLNVPIWYNINEPLEILANSYNYEIVMGNTPVTYVAHADHLSSDGIGIILKTTLLPSAAPQLGDDITIQLGQPALIVANGSDNYSWDLDPSIFSINAMQDTLIVLPNASTTYTAYSEGVWCGIESSQITVFVVDENQDTLYTHIDTDTSYRMSLPYPNPAHNQCTIDFNDVTEDIYLQLIDITGKIIQDYVVPAGSHQLNINTSNLPNGSYYYLLKDVEGQTKTGKIVVVHL